MEATPKGHVARAAKVVRENNKCHGRQNAARNKLNLTSDDIPCSSVGNSENVGKWTIPELNYKFWLSAGN